VRAQIESEDVDAVSVFMTGDKDNSARNANIDDLTVFASTDRTAELRTPVGKGGGLMRRTICGLPHLAELFRELDLDDLPSKVAKSEGEDGCPHEQAWVQSSFLDPDEGCEEDEYGAYMLCNWKTQGDQFRVGVGLEICWVRKEKLAQGESVLRSRTIPPERGEEGGWDVVVRKRLLFPKDSLPCLA